MRELVRSASIMPRARLGSAIFVIAALVLTLACAAPGFTSSQTILRSSGCGQVGADYPDVEGGSGLELVRVHAISCKRARRVAVECIRRFHVSGWRAWYDHRLLGHLRNGRKRIVVKGIAGGGPHCIPSPFARLQAQFRRCGQIGSSAGWGYGDIRAYGVTCAVARHVIRVWGPHPNGWRLIHRGTRDEFRKGRKRITGIPLGD